MFYNDKIFYICVVIDLYARLVIRYKIGNKNNTQLVKSTFQQAYSKRHPTAKLIYHTDRGFNYISKTMADYMKSLGITHSFSMPYVPYDNSIMESFFSSLKRKELYRTNYKSEKNF
ncbi:MAG: transposase family protein [Clostridiales bacterium]|nr:transposase family protein [Clostridiales bacterium]